MTVKYDNPDNEGAWFEGARVLYVPGRVTLRCTCGHVQETDMGDVDFSDVDSDEDVDLCVECMECDRRQQVKFHLHVQVTMHVDGAETNHA